MKASIIFYHISLVPSYNENNSEKMDTHFMFNKFFFPKIVLFMRKCGKRYGKATQSTSDNIIPLMRCACWIPKATDTNSEYDIILAFPLQQWLQECASVLRYTYIACLVWGTARD